MVTGFYAGILALVYVLLTFRIMNLRRLSKVLSGDVDAGGRPVDHLGLAVRIHGNFAEYVPFALALMLLCEMQDMSRPAVHGLGLTLLAGRLLHIIALSKQNLVLRVAGMVLTLSVFIAAGLFLICHAI